jgi:hypothetical protein
LFFITDYSFLLAAAAPVMRPTALNTPVASSMTHISLFNANNTNSCFINPTSDFLNRTIFTNAQAGLNLTLYIGKYMLRKRIYHRIAKTIFEWLQG